MKYIGYLGRRIGGLIRLLFLLFLQSPTVVANDAVQNVQNILL